MLTRYGVGKQARLDQVTVNPAVLLLGKFLFVKLHQRLKRVRRATVFKQLGALQPGGVYLFLQPILQLTSTIRLWQDTP